MKKIGIVGLGYVGLPLAYHFDKAGFQVIGFDISFKRIDELKHGIDTTQEVGNKISESKILFTQDSNLLRSVDVIIVTVPTPINQQNNPDFTPLIKASETVGSILQRGQIVVYESTVYPGCTEEICLPILKNKSGLHCPEDFSIGYSPERINPGDKHHTVDKIVKIVAGINETTTTILGEIYGTIITAGIHMVSSIAVAEAAKIIENTQRDVNIALMNELKIIFDAANINTSEVLEAAGTKWNFLKFYPGMVGGHCIGIDPYWLAYKAQGLGINPELILAGRRINDNYPIYIASRIIKYMGQQGVLQKGAKVLVLGLTFKPNVPDFRNSKIADLTKELQSYGLDVYAFDPYHNDLNDHDMKEYNLVSKKIIKDKSAIDPSIYACIIHAVPHKELEDCKFCDDSLYISVY